MDRTVLDTTTQGQSGPGRYINEGILYIPQSSKTRASPLNDLVLYPGRSVEWGILLLYKDAVSVFYRPSQLGSFYKDICAKGNINCLFQDLNLDHQFHFLRQ